MRVELQRGTIENAPCEDDGLDSASITDLLCRISRDHQNVRLPSGLQTSPLGSGFHNPGWVEGGGANGLERRKAAGHQQLQFMVNPLSLEYSGIRGVGSCGEQDPRIF